jgi:hypothetical protein
LRRHATAVGRTPAFTILDREDTRRLVARLAKDLRLEGDLPTLVEALERARTPEVPGTPGAVDPARSPIATLRVAYETRCRQANAFDFVDLLTEPLTLLAREPSVRGALRTRFRAVLVDEAQDLCALQHALIEALAAPDGALTLAGDDDQAIYGWRGADLTRLHEFERTYPGGTVLAVGRNYRSTPQIVTTAARLIAHNRARRPKPLAAVRRTGPDPTVLTWPDDRSEDSTRRGSCDRICRSLSADRPEALAAAARLPQVDGHPSRGDSDGLGRHAPEWYPIENACAPPERPAFVSEQCDGGWAAPGEPSRPGGTVPPCEPCGTPAPRGGALRVHGGGAAPTHRCGAGGVHTRDLRARTDAGPDRPPPGRGPVPADRGRRPRGASAVGAPDGGPARTQARRRSIQRPEEPPGPPRGHERSARCRHGGLPGDPQTRVARGPLVVPVAVREPGGSPRETHAVRPRFPGSGPPPSLGVEPIRGTHRPYDVLEYLAATSDACPRRDTGNPTG